MKVYNPVRAVYQQKKRYQYNKECPWCKSNELKPQISNELSNKYWLVIASKYPYLDGNMLIVPRRHIEDLDKMTEEEKTSFFFALDETKKILSKIIGTKSFNIAINIGEYSGATIRHVHWLIIPRTPHTLNAVELLSDLQSVTMNYQDLLTKIKSEYARKTKSL